MNYRPHYHFTPPRNWMNDPNGMVWFDGEYHLFYQYNPKGDRWGHMSWGHAVSPDLVHWQHLPVALNEEDNLMIYSGSAVVDTNNTSGFGINGQPPLVAIYTGHHTNQARQDQRIAYSTDRGRTWTSYSGNPVLDIDTAEFRDPKVFWHAPTRCWMMVIALPTDRKVAFYTSPDLKQWTLAGDFGPAGSTEGLWECPDLFPLPVDGDIKQTKWVLLVNVNPGAPAGGSGCQYFIGTFNGERFVAEEKAQWLDYGPDFYAAVSWSDLPERDGRRIIIGWMNNWLYANETPTSPWRGAMSIPRELTLRRTRDGLRLCQQPVRELTAIRRGPAQLLVEGCLQDAAEWMAQQRDLPDAFDMELSLAGVTADTVLMIDLFLGEGEENKVTVVCDVNRQSLRVNRTQAGQSDFHPSFAAVHEAPLPLDGERLHLRLLLDASSIEVFAQNGVVSLTHLLFPENSGRGLRIRINDAPMNAHVEWWALNAAGPGGMPL